MIETFRNYKNLVLKNHVPAFELKNVSSGVNFVSDIIFKASVEMVRQKYNTPDRKYDADQIYLNPVEQVKKIIENAGKLIEAINVCELYEDDDDIRIYLDNENLVKIYRSNMFKPFYDVFKYSGGECFGNMLIGDDEIHSDDIDREDMMKLYEAMHYKFRIYNRSLNMDANHPFKNKYAKDVLNLFSNLCDYQMILPLFARYDVRNYIKTMIYNRVNKMDKMKRETDFKTYYLREYKGIVEECDVDNYLIVHPEKYMYTMAKKKLKKTSVNNIKMTVDNLCEKQLIDKVEKYFGSVLDINVGNSMEFFDVPVFNFIVPNRG